MDRRKGSKRCSGSASHDAHVRILASGSPGIYDADLRLFSTTHLRECTRPLPHPLVAVLSRGKVVAGAEVASSFTARHRSVRDGPPR